jgi:biofilm protein TabA
MKNVILIFAACFSFLFLNAQNPQRMSNKKAKKWFKKMEWSGGLSMQPHSSINKSEFVYQYAAHKNLWDKTFLFLRTHDLANLEKGDHPLTGDSAVVKVTYGPAKQEEQAKW